jgi:hypothetical protein
VKTVEISRATGTLAEYSERTAGDPLIVTRKGKPIAALFSLPEGVDMESLSLATNPDFIALLERSRESLRQQGGISSEEMRRRVGTMNKRKSLSR